MSPSIPSPTQPLVYFHVVTQGHLKNGQLKKGQCEGSCASPLLGIRPAPQRTRGPRSRATACGLRRVPEGQAQMLLAGAMPREAASAGGDEVMVAGLAGGPPVSTHPLSPESWDLCSQAGLGTD